MALKTGGQGNATSSGGITRFIRFIFDRGAAKKVEQEAQQSARKVADPYAAAGKKMGNDMLSGILPGFSKMERAAKATAQQIKKPFDWLGRELKETFGGRLQQALSLGAIAYGIKSVTQAATELVSALTGLASTAEAFGAGQKEAQIAAQALAEDGLMTVTDAATGLKNLLAAGFSLPEAITLMERFKDTAAFGRQSALSFGQAVASATEGIKNGNSILVDNAGVTKNLSIMLTEAGLSAQDLANASTDASVRQAIFNGIVKESAPMLGDAATYANSAAGEIARMQAETEKAQASIGLKLLPVTGKLATGFNTVLVPAVKWVIAEVETFGAQLGAAWLYLDQTALRIDLWSGKIRRSVLTMGRDILQAVLDVPILGTFLGWTGADEKMRGAFDRQIAATDSYINRLEKRVITFKNIGAGFRSTMEDINAGARDTGAGFTAEVGGKQRVSRTAITPPPKAETEAQRRARLRREAADAARAAREAEKAQQEADREAVIRAQRAERNRQETEWGVGGAAPAIRRRFVGQGVMEAFRREQEKQAEQMNLHMEMWMEKHGAMQSAAQNAAANVVGVWSEAFRQIIAEGATMGEFISGIGRGMAGAFLSGLADLASAKVAENIARAFEMFAMGFGFTALGNGLSAAKAKQAGVGHLAAAAKWGAFGAVVGGAGAAAGGGGGGGGGNVHAGGGAYGREAADKTEPHNITYVYVDPFNPTNPVQTRQIGKAMDLHVQLSGKPEWSR